MPSPALHGIYSAADSRVGPRTPTMAADGLGRMPVKGTERHRRKLLCPALTKGFPTRFGC